MTKVWLLSRYNDDGLVISTRAFDSEKRALNALREKVGGVTKPDVAAMSDDALRKFAAGSLSEPWEIEEVDLES